MPAYGKYAINSNSLKRKENDNADSHPPAIHKTPQG